MFNSELAKTRIRELGITQAHLAKKLNIGESHLSQVINGKANPSVSLVSRLAKELVVLSNQLWHLDDELFEPYQKDVDEEALDPTCGSDYGDKEPDAYKVLSDGIVTPIYKVEENRPFIQMDSNSITFDFGVRLTREECETLSKFCSPKRIIRYVEFMDEEEQFKTTHTLINLLHKLKEATK